MNKPKKMGRLVVQQASDPRRRQPCRQRPRQPGTAPVGTGSRRYYRLLGIAVLCAAAAATAVLSGMLYASGWINAQFVPRKIVMRGCIMTKPEEVLARLNCSSQTHYTELLQAVHNLDTTDERWLTGASVKPLLPRTALLTMHERQPVLRAVIGGAKFWLCSDGTLEQMNIATDHGGAYDRIRQLPSIELAVPPGDSLPNADALLTAAACCEQLLPGLIDRVTLTNDGLLDLYDRKGFRVHLGQPVQIEEKIAALPQALRQCSMERDKLKYLDASNPNLFYQVWKEPQTNTNSGKA